MSTKKPVNQVMPVSHAQALPWAPESFSLAILHPSSLQASRTKYPWCPPLAPSSKVTRLSEAARRQLDSCWLCPTTKGFILNIPYGHHILLLSKSGSIFKIFTSCWTLHPLFCKRGKIIGIRSVPVKLCDAVFSNFRSPHWWNHLLSTTFLGCNPRGFYCPILTEIVYPKSQKHSLPLHRTVQERNSGTGWILAWPWTQAGSLCPLQGAAMRLREAQPHFLSSQPWSGQSYANSLAPKDELGSKSPCAGTIISTYVVCSWSWKSRLHVHICFTIIISIAQEEGICLAWG